MPEIVDARDVLDANSKTRRAFRATVLGSFRRTGPNRWDPYRFVASQAEREIEVLPGLKIQLEEFGTAFRIRSHGRVVRAEWRGGVHDGDRADARTRFMETYLSEFSNVPGRGLKAVIAKKLLDH